MDVQEFAEKDPRGFLDQHRGCVVLDEVQRVPALFSYLQEEIDSDPAPGRFVLTGSQHFGLTEAITQSLAGRIGLLHLLPMSLVELRGFPALPDDLWTIIWTGGYPRIHDRALDPNQWLSDYIATYVQRDVRQVQRVTDLGAFSRFLRLAAGRTGQEENLSALRNDAGLSHPTVGAWLSVLETSFVVFRIPRWHRNLRKRVVKAPKLHFVDAGLACHLLGDQEPGPAPNSWRVHSAARYLPVVPSSHHRARGRGMRIRRRAVGCAGRPGRRFGDAEALVLERPHRGTELAATSIRRGLHHAAQQLSLATSRVNV